LIAGVDALARILKVNNKKRFSIIAEVYQPQPLAAVINNIERLCEHGFFVTKKNSR
jgi:hypothetical protein